MEHYDSRFTDNLTGYDGAEQVTAITTQPSDEILRLEDAWQNMTGGEQVTTGLLGLAAFATTCALTWFNLKKSS